MVLEENLRWIGDTLRADGQRMACLRAVRSLAVNHQPWIAAGFIRNRVWDRLHGYTQPTPHNDIDVLAFDPERTDRTFETEIERQLGETLPGLPFEVRNQARMHIRNGDEAYADVGEALMHWLETATAVAVRLDRTDRFEFLHPFGIDDLLGMIARPTPAGAIRMREFDERMARKRWSERWPKVRILREPWPGKECR
ncbi:MAG: nucleotidyltransferase family protein [Geminicoccaceae bacterium]